MLAQSHGKSALKCGSRVPAAGHWQPGHCAGILARSMDLADSRLVLGPGETDVMTLSTTRAIPEVSDRARALHNRSIVIDGCSFFLRGYNERIREAGLSAINFTVPWPI